MSNAPEKKEHTESAASKKPRPRFTRAEHRAKSAARMHVEMLRRMTDDEASKKRKKQKKQLSPAGAKIVAALEEGIEALRAGQPLTVRTYHFAFPLQEYGPDDVRRVRGLFRMSQTVFAEFLGVDANTIQSWEQGARPVSSIGRRFLTEIEGAPDHWRQRIAHCIARAPGNVSTEIPLNGVD
jgi:hypothetical protein